MQSNRSAMNQLRSETNRIVCIQSDGSLQPCKESVRLKQSLSGPAESVSGLADKLLTRVLAVDIRNLCYKLEQ